MRIGNRLIDFNPRIPYGMRLHRRVATIRRQHFNPRIPYGMRPASSIDLDAVDSISIHASRMGCDGRVVASVLREWISIHASRMGCDFFQSRSLSFQLHFNPRIPYGMRLGRARRTCCPYVFQSTHPVWDATGHIGDVHSDLPISIHASRMGCDAHVRSLRAVPVISIHASRMGCDAALVSGAGRHQQFQSTHPVWDATVLVRPKDAPE